MQHRDVFIFNQRSMLQERRMVSIYLEIVILMKKQRKRFNSYKCDWMMNNFPSFSH